MLKTLGVHFIRHPCLTRTVRVRPQHQKSRAMPVCVSGSVAGRGCRNVLALLVSHRAKLGASTIVHPCTTRTVRVRPPSTKKAGLCLFRHSPAFLVPMAGVEPARYCYQRILSPSRLPIPSHRLIKMCRKTALHSGNNDFTV